MSFRASGRRCRETSGDIRDACGCTRRLRLQPRRVFHLAAQPLVRESYARPFDTFDVNVMGTASVLDAVRDLDGPCAVICITTDKCYENREQVWGYRECDPMGGHDPYSASKGAAELLISSYRRSFLTPPVLLCTVCNWPPPRRQCDRRGDWAQTAS
jgi:CDP-glucose 4,6-dehydratase